MYDSNVPRPCVTLLISPAHAKRHPERGSNDKKIQAGRIHHRTHRDILCRSSGHTGKTQYRRRGLEQVVLVSKSTPTLQVVVNPMLRQGSSIHDGSFAALQQLGADYVRYVPWEPYPKHAVAELDPPTKDGTSWNFRLSIR